MYNDFEQFCERVRSAANDADLLVFDGVPDLTNLPVVRWQGEWHTFIDFAQKANATLLYLHEWRYDPDALIDGIVHDQRTTPMADDDEGEELGELDEGDQWLRDLLKDAVSPWNIYRDTPLTLSCVWFKDGVAHQWEDQAEWAEGHREAVQAVLDKAEQVHRREHGSRSEAAAQKLHVYAHLLAMNPRFTEAKSEEKREFMVERLFGDDLRKEPASYRLLPHLIARRAMLIHWWDIEPAERATIGERARQLYQDGESIKSIAAILRISEAKARAAVKSEN